MKKSINKVYIILVVMVFLIVPTTVLADSRPIFKVISKKMVVGDKFKAQINNNLSSVVKITWSSSEKSIASVSSKGIVTAKKSGKVTLICSIRKGKTITKLKLKVTVVNPALKTTSGKLIIGKTKKITLKNKPISAKYTWSTSNKKIATVNQNGKVTAKKKGTATITCKVKTSVKIFYLKYKVKSIQKGTSTASKNKVKKTLTYDEAYKIAKKYWKLKENDVDKDTGFKRSVMHSPGLSPISYKGRKYYEFHLKWYVESHWSLIDRVYVDIETGKCKYLNI